MERLTYNELKRQVEELARYLSETSPSREELELRIHFYEQLTARRECEAGTSSRCA
jgi:hypothetical protein